jgi:hypothetical protein
MDRVFLAVVLTPIVVTIVAASLGARGELAALVLLFAYAGTAAIGLPVFLLFRRLRWLSFWQAPLGGLLAGTIASLYYALPLDEHSRAHGLQNGLGIILWSTFAALIFWLIAVPGNRALTRRSSGPAGSPCGPIQHHRPPAA